MLAAFAVLSWRLLAAALRAPTPFGSFFAVAVACWIGGQSVVNMAMTVGLAPITGITLPLVSYGGTSLVSCIVAALLALRLSSGRAQEASLPART